jgi:SAM-dependent methyltransferase
MDGFRRKKRLFNGITLRKDFTALEIGPLDRPLLTKDDCRITYVDHMSSNDLKDKYRQDPSVNCDEIVPIDFVWQGTLRPLIDTHNGLDLIIACHVIEHVPDFVTFLRELEELLAPDGYIFLVVPDKEYTFDFLRNLTTVDQILSSFITKQKRPTLNQILDDIIHSSDHSIERGWGGGSEGKQPALTRTLLEGYSIGKDIFERDEYFDCHCWVFTPLNFFSIMQKLCALELLKIGYQDHTATQLGEFEFTVTLKKYDSCEEASKSWIINDANSGPIKKRLFFKK